MNERTGLFSPAGNWAAGRAAGRAGLGAYERKRVLPRLIPVTQAELAGDGAEAARGIVARLERALRAERRRGRAGHWTYDLNRHIALSQALGAERRRLAILTMFGEKRAPTHPLGAAAPGGW